MEGLYCIVTVAFFRLIVCAIRKSLSTLTINQTLENYFCPDVILSEEKFVSLCREPCLTWAYGGVQIHFIEKTKRYALLLQVENLGNFHHCKESSEYRNNGSETEEERHSGFTRMRGTAINRLICFGLS